MKTGTKAGTSRLEDRVRVRRFILGELETNCYLVWSPATRAAMVVDPGGDAAVVLAEIARAGLVVVLVANTHGHADHTSGNGGLVQATGAPLAIGAGDAPMLTEAEANLSLWLGRAVTGPAPDRLLHEGDVLDLGGLRFTVLATPGHTPGGVTLAGEGVAFTGDTLFAGGIGRTDLPGGDEALLLASIRQKLLSLPDTVVVYPGHGEASTIGAERRGNPFLSG